MALPEWLRPKQGKDEYILDADILYPQLMEEYGITEDELDQYWLEIILNTAKCDARRALYENGLKEAGEGKPQCTIKLNIQGDKRRWRQVDLPVGKGATAGMWKNDGRKKYLALRGEIPA